MVKAPYLIFLFVLISLHSIGQVYEFTDPETLPYNINSDAQEALPVISPDKKLLFFSRSVWDTNVGGRYAGHDIWVSERTSSGWTRASNTYFNFNTKGNDAVIGMNRAGNIAYLMRTYPSKKLKGIYFTKRIKGVWSEPELIPIEGLETLGSVGFYMHPDEDVLLISMQASDAIGAEDIYVCTKGANGVWSKPKNLGRTINTPGYEISPFLSEDKRKLYFASNGHKGLGDADIFVSQRLYDSWETWTVPVNLGNKINSKNFDGYFSIYGDTLAYFVSNKNNKFSDIYSVGVTVKDEDPNRKAIPLKEEEIAELIGGSVKRKLEFSRQNTSLDATQRELLWFIANKLISKKDVRIMLVPSKEDTHEITSNRFDAIIAQLVSGGIEGSRIRKTENPEGINASPSKGEIQLVFVR